MARAPKSAGQDVLEDTVELGTWVEKALEASSLARTRRSPKKAVR